MRLYKNYRFPISCGCVEHIDDVRSFWPRDNFLWDNCSHLPWTNLFYVSLNFYCFCVSVSEVCLSKHLRQSPSLSVCGGTDTVVLHLVQCLLLWHISNYVSLPYFSLFLKVQTNDGTNWVSYCCYFIVLLLFSRQSKPLAVKSDTGHKEQVGVGHSTDVQGCCGWNQVPFGWELNTLYPLHYPAST